MDWKLVKVQRHEIDKLTLSLSSLLAPSFLGPLRMRYTALANRSSSSVGLAMVNEMGR